MFALDGCQPARTWARNAKLWKPLQSNVTNNSTLYVTLTYQAQLLKFKHIHLSFQNQSTVTRSCDSTIGILVLVALVMKSIIFHNITTCSKPSFVFILVTCLGQSLWYISWFSTGYTYTSVDFRRATSIYQLTFIGLNVCIILFSSD
jgi:hypothetical protein